MLIYQIYPRSFKDSNGDGIGDLAGIAEKIPYIARLGVDAVWISPFVQSPQKDFGYDVSDYCAVDPRFGTLEDFKRLVKSAHRSGLKLIMDQVFCHCSDRNPWFRQSRTDAANPRADWFVWANAKRDGSPPNNWLSYFGGPAWSWDARRRQYYFHQFLSSQPTFNLRNKEVRRALLRVGKFWLELRVDGFRLDAVHTGFADPRLRDNPPRPKNMPVAPDVPESIPQARQIRLHSEAHADTLPFLEELRELADRYDALLLGEVSGEDPYTRAALYTSGKRLHTAYTFGLLKQRPDAGYFRLRVVSGEKRRGTGRFCYALSNHDVPRVASRWRTSERTCARLKRSAFLFLLTLPGDACIYQGEELGLIEAEVPFEKMMDPFGLAFYPEFKGRDGSRTPFPWAAKAHQGGFSRAHQAWLPFYQKHRAFAVDVQEKNKSSMLHFSRAAIRWRKSEPVLQEGDFRALQTSGGLIGFERYKDKRSLLCFFNFAEKSASYVLPAAKAQDIFSIASERKGARLRLGAMGCVILEK